jgi:ribosomal protein L11 methyltransferase
MAGEWLEVSVPVRPHEVEPAADVLRRYAPAGVVIEEKILPLDDEGAYEVDRSRPVVLRVYLPRDGSLPSLRRRLRADLLALGLRDGLPRLRGRVVRGEDWAEAWKRHFDVTHVGRRLVICPTWREYVPAAEEVVIRLDPGMAFGTGHHSSTRMCLEALEGCVRAGQHVLDLGTGSGILAVAAALLGAARVDALDIEPQAVAAARDNTRLNGVDDRVVVVSGSLGDAWPLAEACAGRYDVVVANISAAVIVELVPALVSALRPGGIGIAGGVMGEFEMQCVGALGSAGGRIAWTMQAGEWRTLVFSRG